MEEEPEETLYGRAILLSEKSPWENPKAFSGLEEKSEEVAAPEEEDTSNKGKDSWSPTCSNKKRIHKTWIDELAKDEPTKIEHKYMYMWMSFLMLMVISVSGADGKVHLQRGNFRKTTIAADETQRATDPVFKPLNDSVFSIFARGGHDPERYECTSDFVSKNRSCNIVVGDRSKAECEGLQISGNASYTYIALVGSKMIHDLTIFCIYQQVPSDYSLYFLEVSKIQEQASDCTSWRNAFIVVIPLLIIIMPCMTLAIQYIYKRR
ncbi:uncharacterized protein LOC105444693 [Strongylocentrotus purpuratus]|uniref:Uncharacterized protein n=1 Tax=Strongylocentrotus purpuratus TaxID=7668 RepID=A0A7M7NE65_STRPU|nr:uncharacterized protein LOC105444693 [Strongylocentrotus purpuratus]XP_030835350.1 uncharacterized protein LOC105444693 [Strongylocentrotus purpuratus]